MSGYTIFIIEDDAWYGEILQYHLSLNPDYQVSRFEKAKDALQQLHLNPDLITIDFSLPDMDGKELLKKIKEQKPDTPVIVISGQEDITTAVQMLKAGASDYIVKDENTKDLLWNSVIKIKENQLLKNEVLQLKTELGKKYKFENTLLGNAPSIKKIFELIEKATKTTINISITGETGTGKEMVAKSIHYYSERKNKTFVAVNMSAIPKDLVESELFGYEKGAFTGANTRKIGKFEEANKGTLFLDEIAEMDLHLQSKLLRVLQERELVRLGGNETVSLDFKLIVATHKDLLKEVENGNFREDLYYRIMGLTIDLPPLRDRGTDILLLAKSFVEAFVKQNKMDKIIINTAAQDKLMSYHYPGNIRELKSVVELAVALCSNSEILPEDIKFNTIKSNDYLLQKEMTLKEYTNFIVQKYLDKYEGNVLKVAEVLDLGKSTIYKMIQLGDVKN